MKVLVAFESFIGVDIPEKLVKDVLNMKDHLDQASEWAALVESYNKDSSNINWEEVDIKGIYNPFVFQENGVSGWENKDYDEIIWE